METIRFVRWEENGGWLGYLEETQCGQAFLIDSKIHRAVGRVSNMAARASRSGKHWFQGTAFSQLAFD